MLSSFKQLMFGEAGHPCYVTFLSIHLALEATGDSRLRVLVYVYTHMHTCAFQFVLIVL